VSKLRALSVCAALVFLALSTTLHADGSVAYSEALQLIDEKSYPAALAKLRRLQREHPGFEKLSAVQTRIAVLQESADAKDSLPVFLSALNLRDEGDVAGALVALDSIAQKDPAGALTDDALYITAYLLIMDRYEFAAAREALETLEQRFPESAYTDSAQYLNAIAMEQLGDTTGARQALIELRDRHTALSLPMDFRWPAGSVLSRYWFDRADRRLAIVQERISGASRVSSQEQVKEGQLRLSINVGGVDMQLLLEPSPLTRQTEWLNAGLQNQAPPSVGVFDGSVEGVENSWVRVVLSDGAIKGVVNINGAQQRLTPANLMGTLDYYQPRSKKGTLPGSAQSSLANRVQNLDMLIAPPADIAQRMSGRSRTVQTDVRAVPISIVVDSQYDRYYAGAGLEHALSNLNVADGVYRQFGLALSLDEALKFDETGDPLIMGAVSLETILRTFRDYRLQYRTLFEDSALSYLFTGNPKTDATLGLAWIDTACRSDGYDVGVTTPTGFGDVLLTHELGHSLGARHDSDTQCSNNQSAIMWPNISERTSTSFSACSRESVLAARNKSCLHNSVDLKVSASTTGTTVSFTISNPDKALTLDAQLVVETSAPEQLRWPDGCQAQTPTSARCTLSALLPRESRQISFPVSEDFQNSDAPVTAQVSPIGILELQKTDNLATVSLNGVYSSEHLPVYGNGETLQPLAAADEQGTPVTGAARESGLLDAVLIWLLSGLVLVRYRLHRAEAPNRVHRQVEVD